MLQFHLELLEFVQNWLEVLASGVVPHDLPDRLEVVWQCNYIVVAMGFLDANTAH